MKKIIVLSAIAFFALSSVCSALTVTGKRGTMLREAPNGKKIEKLVKGTMLEFSGEIQNKWLKVTTNNGKTGWVHLKNTDYITASKKGTKKATHKAYKKSQEMKSKPKMVDPDDETGDSDYETNTEMPEDEDI